MGAGQVNDVIRENMSAIARWLSEQNGSLETAGSGDNYTLTTTSSHAALADLQIMLFRTDRANSGLATLKVDGLAAKPWRHPDGTELAEGALKANALQVVSYNSIDDVFHWLGPLPQDVRRLAGQFAAHASEPAALTVGVDAGFLLDEDGALITKAAQTTSTFTAPSGNPRNDIVVLLSTSGNLAVRAGSEAASPSDPSLTAGDLPLARVRLTVGMTEITDADIDDLRPLFLAPNNVDTNAGVAKVLATWDGTDTDPITPSVSENVDDITKNGTGDYTVNFTNSLASANYHISGAGFLAATVVVGPAPSSRAAGSCRVLFSNTAGALVDPTYCSFKVDGTLA